MSRFRLLPIALFLPAALAPASAAAQNASVAKTGIETVYTGSSAVDDIGVSLNNPPAIIFQRSSGALIDAGANCNDVFADKTRISCLPGTVTFHLNGGDDKVSGGSDGHGMTYNGGAGNDTITPGGQAQHHVNGDDGDDRLTAVTIGRDVVDGGAGDDTILFPRGADELHGGPGSDWLELSSASAFSVSLDGVADDGVAAETKFNAHPDVENVRGGDLADTLIGAPAANVLEGGKGGDILDGGAGADTLRGGEGDDTIDARDGNPDSIDCGVGNDTATIDAADLPATGCETVRLPAEDLGGAPGAAAPAPAAAPPGPPTSATGDTLRVQPGGVRNRWAAGRRTKVMALEVRDAPTGAEVRVSCTGRGCAFKRRTLTVGRDGRAALTRRFRHRALAPGTVIEVRITAAGHYGKVVRYTIRRGKLPTSKVLCLRPGASKPVASC